jgi:GABA(A) receptor-associated protein
MNNFKEEFTFNQRLHEAVRIRERYPKRIPCIVESKSSNLNLDKKKYLVPVDLTIGQFVYIIRKRINLSPEKAVFIFVNNIIPPSSTLISQIYQEYKESDSFLYFVVSLENTFGIF